MELARTLVAISIVLSIIGFWIFKARYYLLLTPFFAPLALCALHLYCAYWIYYQSTSYWGLVTAYGIAQFLSRPIHSIFNRVDLMFVQKRRDEMADRIFNSEVTIPFALYLRPFVVTDRLSFYGLSTKWGGVDLESLIANACRSWGSLVGLGRPGEAIGAGRIASSDEDWKKKFFLLAEKARSIVMVPAINEGTLFEITWIKNNGFLGKTIFLMPPRTRLRMTEIASVALTSSYDSTERDYAKNWEDVRERLCDLGIALPPYAMGGALIQFSDDGGRFSQYMFGDGVPSIKKVLKDRLAI